MRLEKAKIRYPKENENKRSIDASKLRSGAYSQSFTGEYYNIDIEKLIPFKNQARKYFDEDTLSSLALTIKEHGIRQPLTVLPSESQEGFFEVVSGERRLRAAIKVGLKKIPCIIIFDHKKAEEIAIIENIQRENLHPLELATAYNQLLINNICKSTQDIADKLGIHKSSVIENLNLLVLNEDIKQKILDQKIKSRDFLRKLCKTDQNKQHDLIDEYLLIKNNDKAKIKQKKVNFLKSSNTILTLCLENGELKINKNAISKLNSSQKNNIKLLFESLIKEL